MVINEPLLLKKEFISCKKQQLNYIAKIKENPFTEVFENWRKIVYLDDPYAFNSNGYEKDIKNINYQDILNEYNDFKKRDKYLLSNFKIKNLKNLNRYIFKNGVTKSINNIEEINLESRDRYIDSFTDTNQIIIMLGNQTCPYFSRQYLTLKILESHLSFGMSSLLFKLFREKNGLTYDVGIFNQNRYRNSPFLIYLSVSIKNASIAFELLKDTWKDLLIKKLTDEELTLAKVKLKSAFLNSNQTVDEFLNRKVQLIGHSLNPYLDDEFLEEIDSINAKEIRDISNIFLSKPFLSVRGEKNKCEEIKKVWLNNF